MLVTLFGIVTFVRETQSWNAQLLILVMLFGIVTLVRSWQPENAEDPMLVTLTISLPLFHLFGNMTSLTLANKPSLLKSVAFMVTLPPSI